ncbi:undecaprenyl-diphosphate phosphatase, partial [bacterium]|nr:undecaprenyl-diphosphate phosphatase [bacterium]
MTVTQGIVMGLVQGLTEFLPVSSSGHLAAARSVLGAGLAEDVGFEVAVHLGTLLAVLVFFRKKIISIFSEAFTGEGEGRKWLMLIFIGTIPAGVIGLLAKDHIEILFNSMKLVGVAWIFTAIILFVSERFASERFHVKGMGVWRALGIGFAQAIALIPGISRSGSTVAACMLLGIKKKGAVDFVFIMSLPAVGGA